MWANFFFDFSGFAFSACLVLSFAYVLEYQAAAMVTGRGGRTPALFRLPQTGRTVSHTVGFALLASADRHTDGQTDYGTNSQYLTVQILPKSSQYLLITPSSQDHLNSIESPKLPQVPPKFPPSSPQVPRNCFRVPPSSFKFPLNSLQLQVPPNLPQVPPKFAPSSQTLDTPGIRNKKMGGGWRNCNPATEGAGRT